MTRGVRLYCDVLVDWRKSVSRHFSKGKDGQFQRKFPMERGIAHQPMLVSGN